MLRVPTLRLVWGNLQVFDGGGGESGGCTPVAVDRLEAALASADPLEEVFDLFRTDFVSPRDLWVCVVVLAFRGGTVTWAKGVLSALHWSKAIVFSVW